MSASRGATRITRGVAIPGFSGTQVVLLLRGVYPYVEQVSAQAVPSCELRGTLNVATYLVRTVR